MSPYSDGGESAIEAYDNAMIPLALIEKAASYVSQAYFKLKGSQPNDPNVQEMHGWMHYFSTSTQLAQGLPRTIRLMDRRQLAPLHLHSTDPATWTLSNALLSCLHKAQNRYRGRLVQHRPQAWMDIRLGQQYRNLKPQLPRAAKRSD